jgi:hypothetical protein
MDGTVTSLAQGIAPLTQPVRRLVDGTAGRVLRWPAQSQQRARRNALVASTALARRRAERIEVEEFLAALLRSGSSASTGSYRLEAHHG